MDKKYMKKALKLAKLGATKGEVPIGAIIVKDGQIIAQSHNKKEELNDPTAHAELLVIKEASNILGHWWLEDCTLYTTLEPCPMCTGAILNARIPRVVIGTTDPNMGACGGSIDLSDYQGFYHKFDVTTGICQLECQRVLTEFFKRLR